MIINFDNTIKSKLIDVFNNENSAVLIVDALASIRKNLVLD
jgi:hypothetical protein